jgi:hypothetical protein
LRQAIADRLSGADIAERLGRTQHAVEFRANQLGLMLHCDLWSERELGILRDHYATTPITVIAKRIGRSCNAVMSMASKHGVRSSLWGVSAPLAELRHELSLPGNVGTPQLRILLLLAGGPLTFRQVLDGVRPGRPARTGPAGQYSTSGAKHLYTLVAAGLVTKLDQWPPLYLLSPARWTSSFLPVENFPMLTLKPRQDDRITRAYPLVAIEARRFRTLPPGVGVDDLESVGGEALVEAAANHDDDRGPWLRFARAWARNAMRGYLSQSRRRSNRMTTLEVETPDGESMPRADRRAADPCELAGVRERLTTATLPDAKTVVDQVTKLRNAMFDAVDVTKLAAMMNVLQTQTVGGD